METKTVKHFYQNLKDGDFIGSYKKKWFHLFAKAIYWFTGEKVSHIVGVFDVKKRDNVLTFKLGEQSFFDGRKVNSYSIVKDNLLDIYTIDSRFKDKSTEFYYLPNENKLTRDQLKVVKKFWNQNEDYDTSELLQTVNWFNKLFGREDKKVYDGVCSTAARQSMIKAGIKDDKFDDPAPSPIEFIRSSYIDAVIKIKF